MVWPPGRGTIHARSHLVAAATSLHGAYVCQHLIYSFHHRYLLPVADGNDDRPSLIGMYGIWQKCRVSKIGCIH